MYCKSRYPNIKMMFFGIINLKNKKIKRFSKIFKKVLSNEYSN